jgi:hypothetical protein
MHPSHSRTQAREQYALVVEQACFVALDWLPVLLLECASSEAHLAEAFAPQAACCVLMQPILRRLQKQDLHRACWFASAFAREELDSPLYALKTSSQVCLYQAGLALKFSSGSQAQARSLVELEVVPSSSS